MVPDEEPPYLGIVQLLLHFRWTWIGLFAPENDNGERFIKTITPVLTRNGICVTFSRTASHQTSFRDLKAREVWNAIRSIQGVKVILYYGATHSAQDVRIVILYLNKSGIHFLGKFGSQ